MSEGLHDVSCQDAYVEENRALVDLLAKGRSHVQELQTAATAFQPEDPTEAAMAHVSAPPLWCCAKQAMLKIYDGDSADWRARRATRQAAPTMSVNDSCTAVRSCLQPS